MKARRELVLKRAALFLAPHLVGSAGFLIAIFAWHPADAAGPTTIYSGSGNHSISTSSTSNVEVRDQASLLIAPRGHVETSFPPVARVLNQGHLSVSGQLIGNGSGTGEPALQAEDSATVEVDGGVVSIDSSGASAAVPRAGARLMENASLKLIAGTIQESGSGSSLDRAGILAEGNSRVEMLGGVVRSQGSGSDSNRFGISARGQSRISVSGGLIDVGGSGDGDQRVGILAADQARVSVFGGLMQVGGSGIDFESSAIVARGQARVEIFGGGVAIPSIRGGADLVADDFARIIINGSGFNLPYGPVLGTAGTISGVLSDGSAADLSFRRAAGATIILAIPEPSALMVALSALMAIGCVRKSR